MKLLQTVANCFKNINLLLAAHLEIFISDLPQCLCSDFLGLSVPPFIPYFVYAQIRCSNTV
jgi:hypothetical protein